MKIKFIIGSYTGGETSPLRSCLWLAEDSNTDNRCIGKPRPYDHVYGLDYRTIYLNFIQIVGQNSLYRNLTECGTKGSAI